MARIAVDVPLAHLDRPFDYLVPQRLAAAAVPGCRVRVRFAGQLTGGYLLERAAVSEHPGRLAYLERVVSPEPVLSPEIAALAREVADRCAGTLADVLRLAIPPRHAGAEAQAGGLDGAAASVRRRPAARAAPAAGAGAVGALPGREGVPRRARGRAGAACGLVGAARAAVAGGDRDGGSGGRVGRAGHAHRGAGRPGPEPHRRRAGPRARAGPARLPFGRARARRALPALAVRGPRDGTGGGRHPGRHVRPGPRPRPGRHLGRRGRPARRAACPLSPRAGGPRAAGAPGRRGSADRRVRPHRRGGQADRHRLGGRHHRRPPDRPQLRAAGPGGGRRRRARPGRGGPVRADAEPGAAHGARRAGPRPGPGPGAEAGLCDRCRLRELPGSGPLPGLRRPARPGGGRRPGPLPVVRAGRSGLAVPGLRGSPASVPW